MSEQQSDETTEPEQEQQVVDHRPRRQGDRLRTGVDAAAPPTATATSEDGERNLTDLVEQPAKVMRIGSMISQLLEEVKAAPLDEASRNRLKEIHAASIKELEPGLAPELVEELQRLSLPFAEDTTPSEGELRIAQAQLVGWLEGLFHGIQTAIYAQQMAARAQFEQMRRALPPAHAARHGPGQRPVGRATQAHPAADDDAAPAPAGCTCRSRVGCASPATGESADRATSSSARGRLTRRTTRSPSRPTMTSARPGAAARSSRWRRRAVAGGGAASTSAVPRRSRGRCRRRRGAGSGSGMTAGRGSP